MAMDFIGLSVGMGYTDETVIGGGALKGKNCVVSNIEEVADGVNVTFQSILDDGTVKTDTAFIPKGTQGDAGVAGNSSRLGSIDGVIHTDMEMGFVEALAEGFYYADSTTRVRTKKGCEVALKAGDKIELTSYNNARFLIAYFKEDGSQVTTAWRKSSILVPLSTNYGIMIAHDPDSELSSVKELSDLLKITRRTNANTYFNENIDFIEKVNIVLHKEGLTEYKRLNEFAQIMNGTIDWNNNKPIEAEIEGRAVTKSRFHHNGTVRFYRLNENLKLSVQEWSTGESNHLRKNTEYDENDVAISFNPLYEYTFIVIPKTGNIVMNDANCGYIVFEETGEEVNKIPDYWKDELDDAVTKVNNLAGNIGADGTSFIFWTDQHWGANYKKSPLLIKHIMENTSIKTVVSGGDTLNGSYATVDEAYKDLCSIRNTYRSFIGDFIPVRGNHDYKPDGSMVVSNNMFYGAMLQPIKEKLSIAKNTYFYKDDNVLQLRCLFLDTKGTDNDGMGEEQIDWFKERVMELTGEWKIIIFMHAVHTSKYASTGETNLSWSYPAYQLFEALHTITPSASIIAMIGGHVHRDYSSTIDDILLISTTTDAGGTTASDWDINYPVRTKGTTTEQAFDVFQVDLSNRKIYATRIGAGKDREWEY